MSTTTVAAAPTPATFASKVTDKSAFSVKYSSDITASWTTEDKSKNSKGKGSLAGSLYYTATDNDSQSECGSAYDAVSLADSDKDFQIEVASTAEGAQQQGQPAAPVVLFGGSGLESTSAATANTRDEEFDYAFDNGARQGATYQRVFKPQPAPVHMISALHQAHLGSLAEDSEEGSDVISESDGGLIHDDDLPIESSPAVSASLDQSPAQMAAGSSTNSTTMPGDKVRYPEALIYFLSADVKAIKKTLNKSKPVHRMASCFMRMQKSSKRLEQERTRLLCLAKMPFDDSNLMHLRLLQSVYLSFVGGPGPVSRYGPHWVALGFQGSDPTTDLRGCGILGLLHLLLLHEHDPANAHAIFKLSTAKDSEFPLAPVSLNITKWTLQMVRERKLTSAAKKQQSAVTAASDFYVGTFYTLYNHWKDKKCTMADSGFVLKEIEKRACSNVMNMVRRAVTTL
ncbi:hypothetical protein WJX79_007272 [Trebouxia sp. C0005]